MRRHIKAFVSLTKKIVAYVDHNVAVFPIICTAILALLVVFSVNGSSIGVFHQLFYGDTHDPQLIANSPRSIRSDEWIVSTEKVIGQSNNNYDAINKNVGLGENQTLLVGAPTRDWSTIFHLDNLGFFILPFDNAFSLKWWLPSYLLLIAVYFFALIFLPKRAFLAALISISFLLSPFIQWWSAYTPFIWALVGFIAFIKLFHSRSNLGAAAWGLLLAYSAICFTLILYPPFLIPIFYVTAALAIGYLIDNPNALTRIKIYRGIVVAIVAILTTVVVLLTFLHSHQKELSIIQNTAYPGKRIINSGGFSATQLLASQTGIMSQDDKRAAANTLTGNQSEGSNFMLISTYLILPLLYIIIRRYKERHRPPYSVILPLLSGSLFLVWMFIPGLSIVGKITLLNMVPFERALIGLGMLNLVCIIQFIRLYSKERLSPPHTTVIIYSLLVIIVTLCINYTVAIKSPGYIGYKWAIILSIPFALIIYLLLQRKFIIGISVFCLFSFFSVNRINPLYVGTNAIRETDISQAMVDTSHKFGKERRWAGDYIQLENFPSMNGLPSLSGTYVYPQLDIWNILDQPAAKNTYNRYAHINFSFDRDPESKIMPMLTNPGQDQLNVKIEPCDPFLQKMNIGYLLTTVPFDKEQAGCLNLVKKVTYPQISFYIYTTSF